jgi:sulfur carrier protein ThiS
LQSLALSERCAGKHNPVRGVVQCAAKRGVKAYSFAMVRIEFAPALQRHVPCPAQQVPAGTLAQVLQQALQAAPALAHYVLDDQGHIRKHVAVFINGTMHRDRDDLSRVLANGDRVHVIQALTGG